MMTYTTLPSDQLEGSHARATPRKPGLDHASRPNAKSQSQKAAAGTNIRTPVQPRPLFFGAEARDHGKSTSGCGVGRVNSL